MTGGGLINRTSGTMRGNWRELLRSMAREAIDEPGPKLAAIHTFSERTWEGNEDSFVNMAENSEILTMSSIGGRLGIVMPPGDRIVASASAREELDDLFGCLDA